MTSPNSSPPPAPLPVDRRHGTRRWRWLLTGILAVMAVLAAMILSFSPAVPAPEAGDAASAAAARGVLEQITGDQTARGKLVRITLSQNELDGLAALSSDALAPLRVQARLQPLAAQANAVESRHLDDPAAPTGELVVQMSREVGWGLWVNATATLRPHDTPNETNRADGVPAIAVTLGRLPVPQALTRWALDRMWLDLQGDIPAPVTLDQAVRDVAISADSFAVALINPGRGVALAGLARAQGTTPDPGALAASYCAIADTTETDLAVLVRRAAALKVPEGTDPQDHNLTLLVAVAMRAVPKYHDRLAGSALPLVANCIASPAPLTLQGREDLAMHWALSAALAATLGGQVARSMGTWKELADSIDGGTGFSFVDLAADRSGERFAIAAVDPRLARAVHSRLRAITEEQMLPRALLTRPEGLDQAAFERDYTSVTSPEYAAAVRTIDALLANAGVP